MCAPYFVKEHFSVKTLLFLVHLRSQQKRTEKVIASYQIYIAAISTLLFESIAIISNVQMSAFSVDISRQTRRWRGSQQTGPVRTTRRSDARAARRRP